MHDLILQTWLMGAFNSNSGDFRVRKIGRSKLHSVLPMNENEFRFSEVSYHLKKPNFLKGAFRTLGMLPREYKVLPISVKTCIWRDQLRMPMANTIDCEWNEMCSPTDRNPFDKYQKPLRLILWKHYEIVLPKTMKILRNFYLCTASIHAVQHCS